jgi:opacity protein-like surface antigen
VPWIINFVIRRLIILFFILLFTNAYAFPYKGLEIEMKGTITETYDDNINLSKDKEEDFITRFGIGVGVKYEDKIRALGVSGSFNYSLYSKHPDIDPVTGNLTLNFQNKFSEYDRISLRNTFTKTFIPFSFEEEFGRVTGQFKSSSNIFTLLYSRDISKKLGFTTRYNNQINRFSGENVSNSSLYSLGFGIGYAYSEITSFLLSYEFSRVRFENTGVSSAHTVVTGFKHFITKRFYVDGRVGTDFITDFNNEKGTIGYFSISLTDEITKNTTINTIFTRRGLRAFEGKEHTGDSVGISVVSNITGNTTVRTGFTRSELNLEDRKQTGDNFNVSVTSNVTKRIPVNLKFARGERTTSDRKEVFKGWQTSGSLTLPLSKRLNALFAGFYGKGDFVTRGESSRLWGGSCGVKYDLSENLKGDFSYSYSNLDSSDEEILGYTRNVISLSLTAIY